MLQSIKNPTLRRAALAASFIPVALLYGGAGVLAGFFTAWQDVSWAWRQR